VHRLRCALRSAAASLAYVEQITPVTIHHIHAPLNQEGEPQSGAKRGGSQAGEAGSK
jgi:hypothetical protein